MIPFLPQFFVININVCMTNDNVSDLLAVYCCRQVRTLFNTPRLEWTINPTSHVALLIGRISKNSPEIVHRTEDTFELISLLGALAANGSKAEFLNSVTVIVPFACTEWRMILVLILVPSNSMLFCVLISKLSRNQWNVTPTNKLKSIRWTRQTLRFTYTDPTSNQVSKSSTGGISAVTYFSLNHSTIPRWKTSGMDIYPAVTETNTPV